MKEAYQKSVSSLYKSLNSSPEGLSQEEAKFRLKKFGKNIIKKKKNFHPLKILFKQFNSFLIYILLAASIISFSINHLIDGSVILGIVLLNAVIGFFQQYRAEKAIQKLKKLILPQTRVIRGGKQIEISSTELVPGDIVLLEAGDKISADLRIIELENAATNESVLTGESLPVLKKLMVLAKETSLSQRKNMLFTGTNFIRGTAKGLVVNTGMKTVFGEIAENLQEIKIMKTPMQKRLDKFSKQIGLIILAFVSIIILLGFTEKFELVEMFLTAVALAVSAIPEGLPAVLTISFAIASILMSKNNVIIRRLPAVESLGSVTVICSDKTGTLTEEKLVVETLFANNKFFQTDENKIPLNKNKELSLLLKTSVLCNNSRYELIENKYEYLGDPTEIALIKNSLKLGLDKKLLIEKEFSIKKFEFDSIRKMMSVVRNGKNQNTMYSKGAIKKILNVSTKELINGKTIKLTSKRKKEILLAAHKMEQKALRVLGFAFRNFSKKELLEEKELIFLGLAGMIDPPRSEVKQAIKECREAGIKVKIITGDSALTAKAVGEKIGIVGRVVEELELKKMSDEELSNSMKEIVIFARVTPKQKLRITQILQKQGETVAITGDGINDVLALKSADVGVAMGKRGTDIARDVSDIVLVDDNFASLVEGVKEGRKTYDNIKKFTKYLLAVNFSEIFLVLFALLLGMPLPLIPLQILWMNLVSDSFPSMSLVFEKGENVMKSKPRKEKSILSGIWGYVIIAGIFAFIVELIVYLISINQNHPIELTRTLVLTVAIVYELLFVYTCRSNLSLHKIGIFSNKWLNIAVIGSFLLHLILLYTSVGNFFSLVPLTINNWLFILPFAISGLIVFEVAKMFKDNKKR
jgi:P-type Ca2+ transporter type 2C